MSELISRILDSIHDTFRHLGAADFTTLAVVAGVVIVVGILIFRR